MYVYSTHLTLFLILHQLVWSLKVMHGKGFYFYLKALLAWGRVKENICPVKQQ